MLQTKNATFTAWVHCSVWRPMVSKCSHHHIVTQKILINIIKFIECSEKVEEVVEEVEIAAEVVEKVATTAEKVSAEVAGKLPDNGKLKAAALVVEHISSVAATDAEFAEDFIQKVCFLLLHEINRIVFF